MCTYANRFARPVDKHAWSLVDICIPRSACSSFSGSALVVIACPRVYYSRHLVKAQALGPKVPRLKRVCRLYTTGTTGDKKQLLFECSELQKS